MNDLNKKLSDISQQFFNPIKMQLVMNHLTSLIKQKCIDAIYATSRENNIFFVQEAENGFSLSFGVFFVKNDVTALLAMEGFLTRISVLDGSKNFLHYASSSICNTPKKWEPETK